MTCSHFKCLFIKKMRCTSIHTHSIGQRRWECGARDERVHTHPVNYRLFDLAFLHNNRLSISITFSNGFFFAWYSCSWRTQLNEHDNNQEMNCRWEKMLFLNCTLIFSLHFVHLFSVESICLFSIFLYYLLVLTLFLVNRKITCKLFHW